VGLQVHRREGNMIIGAVIVDGKVGKPLLAARHNVAVDEVGAKRAMAVLTRPIILSIDGEVDMTDDEAKPVLKLDDAAAKDGAMLVIVA
jgi:hypothetical protein